MAGLLFVWDLCQLRGLRKSLVFTLQQMIVDKWRNLSWDLNSSAKLGLIFVSIELIPLQCSCNYNCSWSSLDLFSVTGLYPGLGLYLTEIFLDPQPESPFDCVNCKFHHRCLRALESPLYPNSMNCISIMRITLWSSVVT